MNTMGVQDMIDVTFRPATQDDHKRLVELGKTTKYTRDFSNTQMFSGEAAYAKGWIRVAEVDGKIVGFTCVRHKTRWPETMLYFIVVDPEYRSLGIGEKLIEDVMAHGPHKIMRLNVMKENEAAVRFYKRLGFMIAGVSLQGHAWSLEKEFA